MYSHTIVFTGHTIDRPNREKPRFPAEAEAEAAALIKKHISAIAERYSDCLVKGISAAACGGDIIFHEQCEALKIDTEVYLGLPDDDFLNTSVEYAGLNWIKRYNKLIASLPVHILTHDAEAVNDKLIWEKANQWMLHEAARQSGTNITLLALWNGQESDGSGGTKHMIEMAQQLKATIDVIDFDQ